MSCDDQTKRLSIWQSTQFTRDEKFESITTDVDWALSHWLSGREI